MSNVPLCVGFGIKDATTAAQVGEYADGVVVGSALVNLMTQEQSPVDVAASLKQAAAKLRDGLDSLG